MKFNITIGDWSGDGHQLREEFLIKSNVDDINVIREAYFNSSDVIGFELGELCIGYAEHTIDEWIHPLINKLISEFHDNYVVDYECLDPIDLIYIIISAIMKTDDSIKLEIVNRGEYIPSLQFYGIDEKGRHLEVPGYGLFTM